jgi:hypothetical protein
LARGKTPTHNRKTPARSYTSPNGSRAATAKDAVNGVKTIMVNGRLRAVPAASPGPSAHGKEALKGIGGCRRWMSPLLGTR